MNIFELIANTDRKQPNNNWVDKEDFSRALGIGCYSYEQEFNKRVKMYWIKSWICTDTEVGLAFYTFDDCVVAVSYQNARKNDLDMRFVSQEAALLMRDFILSLEGYDEGYPLCDLYQKVPDDIYEARFQLKYK